MLQISLDQFKVSSHRLRIESGRIEGIPREGRNYTLCDLHEIESEEHFALRYTIYYAIRGRYHCLFHDGFGPLPHILEYLDQWCLAVFIYEMTCLRDTSLRA